MSMYAMPDRATGTPYRERVNRPIGVASGYLSRIMPSTTRLVLVPMSVHVPPRMEAKDRGMNSCALGMLHLRAHFCTMGTMMATTGVLLRKAETMAMGTVAQSPSIRLLHAPHIGKV